MTLQHLNNLSKEQARGAYAQLVPEKCWNHLAGFSPKLGGGADNPATFQSISCPGHSEVSLRAPAHRVGGDYAFSLDLDDAGGGQMEISFIIINDLSAERFNIDVDDYGQVTLLGTASRNMGEELRAIAAGLGPCQVRRGLKMFNELLPRLETFGAQLGYVGLTLQPLTYHNAIMYENYGFTYLEGRKRMIEINAQFQPGGALHKLLDNRSPFRAPHLALTPRGRSWAIHDGILRDYDGRDSLNMKMVKVIGDHADIHTFTPGG